MSDSTISNPELAKPPDFHAGSQDAAKDAVANDRDGSGSVGSSTQPRRYILSDEAVSPDDATVISSQSSSPGAAAIPGTTPAELGQLLEGERLGHFELEEFIGGGGMGAVFRGTDTALGREVAIKVLLQQYGNDEDTTRRFQNEAQSAARLDHDNIARVYYVGEDRGWYYIVLEYIEGENLRDLVHRHGPLAIPDVIHFTLQIAEALAHASGRDVVHRDIKPSNVLITADGRAKLVDMGLARLHQVDRSHEDLTASGVTLGTFDYISPEQARDPRIADVRSDLYSLGCTFYFMLTGLPPFPEGTVLQKLLQHQDEKPPDARQRRADLDDRVWRICEKLLAKKPTNRYQDPGAVVADLLLVAEKLRLPLPSRLDTVWTTTRAEEEGWFRRQLPWLVPVGLLLIIAVLVHYASPGYQNVPPRRSRAETTAAAGGSTASDVSDDATRKNALPSEATSSAGAANLVNDDGSKTTDQPGQSQAAPSAKDNPSENGSDPKLNGTPAAPTRDPPQEDQTPQAPSDPGESVVESPADEATLADPPKPSGAADLRIVDGKGEGDQFASVADACDRAPSGSVIELRYNGRLPQPERHIQLGDRKITIRGGDGYRPVIHFRPDVPDGLQPRSMIHVSGELDLFDIYLEMETPSAVGAHAWNLFEATLADRIRLEKCWLTIRRAANDESALYKDVTFFYVEAPPKRERPVAPDAMESSRRLNIELRRSVIRGDATLLRGDVLDTVTLQWEDGLLAIGERFVEIRGQSIAPPAGHLLDIQLQHVTAVMNSGFCLMTADEFQRHLPMTVVDCRNSILKTKDAPLIEQSGSATATELRKHVMWKNDSNFYEGFGTFWLIDSMEDMVSLDWSQWTDHWSMANNRESMERPGRVMWARAPAESKSLSQYVPLDFKLDPDSQNTALGAGTDSLNPGFLDGLPDPPPEVERSDPDSDLGDELDGND